MTRISTKMANEFKNLYDTIKELGLKIVKLEEEVITNKETIARTDERVSLLEGKIVYLETQDKLKARKLDDLEQYGRRESLRFNGFQTKQNESSEN